MFRSSPPARKSRSRSRRRSCSTAKGIATRVVSVPCFELLMERRPGERQALIGDAPVNIAVEAAVRQGWDAIIGADGAVRRHDRLRRQRAVQGPIQAFRNYPRGGGQCGAEAGSALTGCKNG